MEKEKAKKDVFDRFKNLINLYKRQEKQFKDHEMTDLVITMKAHREMVELKLKTLKRLLEMQE